MKAAWARFWFSPAPALRLGVARALLFGGLAAIYAMHEFTGYAEVSPHLSGASWLHVPVPTATSLRAMHLLWLVALALAALGLFTRIVACMAFGLGSYLLALDGNFGRVHHNDLPVVIALGVLAASRAGDAFSLDALRRRGPAVPDGEYGWPLRAIQLALALAFLGAGLSKLRHSGLDWITTDSLRIAMLERRYAMIPSHTVLAGLPHHPLLCKALAAATVATELGYPLALFSRRARAVLVPASLLLLLGFAVFFGPRFLTFAVLTAAWVPWERVLALLRRSPGGEAAPAPAP